MISLLALFRDVSKACHSHAHRVTSWIADRIRDRSLSGPASPDHYDNVQRDVPRYDPANPLHRRAYRHFARQRVAHEEARAKYARQRRSEDAIRGAEAFLADNLERAARERAKRRHPSHIDDDNWWDDYLSSRGINPANDN